MTGPWWSQNIWANRGQVCEHLEMSHAWRDPVDTQEILRLCLEQHCPDPNNILPGRDGTGLAGTLESL